MIRFGLVGLLNTGVDFAVFLSLFYGLAWPLLIANSLGYPAWLAKLGASAVTFAWNYWSSDRLVLVRP
jgi:putative flippase GtrA